jgi:ethanolamine utilization protein EutM
MMLYGAIGLLETIGVAISIEAADAMLKAAEITIIKHEIRDISLITLLIGGDLSSVRTAIEEGAMIAKKAGSLLTSGVIPNPDLETYQFFQKEENSRWVSQLVK